MGRATQLPVRCETRLDASKPTDRRGSARQSGVCGYGPPNLNCGFGCRETSGHWLIVLCVRYINLVLGNENRHHTTLCYKLHSQRSNKNS